MVDFNPSIPIVDITNIPNKVRKQLEAQGISDLAQLYLADSKLVDAVTLAKSASITIRDAIDARQSGHRHIENILAEITAKRKVEPLDLLWKIHWFLGTVSEGNHRMELIAIEASAIATILENLEGAKAPSIEKLLQILFHRLLIIPASTLKAELEQLVSFAERFQRSSLLAYQLTKAKPIFAALAIEEEPSKQIVQLQKLVKNWKSLIKVMGQRGEEEGKMILIALQAFDNLKVLDISEEHLKSQVQQTMTTKKLRQSQLTHITTGMNALIQLRDAYSTAKLATRASKIWFELAQGKLGNTLSDDLLRSLRFTRTAIFHFRTLDDLSGGVKQLEHLIHIIGEIPTEPPKILTEALTGALKTFIKTAPLLDRPKDQALILRASKRFDSALSKLLQILPSQETRYDLAELHVTFQQIGLKQLHELGAEPATYQGLTRNLIQAMLRLAITATDEAQMKLFNTVAEHANQLVIDAKSVSQISEQDLEVISDVASQLIQQPNETLSDSAKKLIEESHQLNEQRYLQTKDPQVKAQLALQLLLSQLSPDISGKLSATLTLKDVDKFEEYASTALVAQAKHKQPIQVLKAGSMLVWIVLQRIYNTHEEDKRKKILEDARDFAEQTFSLIPTSTKLTDEAYPFAFLLLRNVNELVHDTRFVDETKWEHLLTQSEQLAQTLAKAASRRDDHSNQILALSAAGTATAKLATITTDRSHRARLMRRATRQIQKALQVASTQGTPADIEAALSQYDQLMHSRLSTTTTISVQIPILNEWNNTYSEVIQALKIADAEESANRLQACKILNTQIPLTFTTLSQSQGNLDSMRRQLTELLREVNQIGSPDQAKLAKQLERRWAFQLGEDSILDSGFRLEDADTSFTLADEHFRISLQVELEVAVEGQALQKIQSFPYLRPSSRPNELIWYDETPVICTTYNNENLYTWLSLQEPREDHVSIDLQFITSEELTATITLQILGTEALSRLAEGVMIQLAGAQLSLSRQPRIAEQRETKGILIYELPLTLGFPETLSLNIEIA